MNGGGDILYVNVSSFTFVWCVPEGTLFNS